MTMERWLSGRRHRFRKPATGKLVQGFKSLPLRSERSEQVEQTVWETVLVFEAVDRYFVTEGKQNSDNGY